jgi:gamma-glutamyltranspeptidase / glutathione hydrolase
MFSFERMQSIAVAAVIVLVFGVIFTTVGANTGTGGGVISGGDVSVTGAGDSTAEGTADPEDEVPALPDDHTQAVVTAHELATQAGVQMLEAGGTAADAAVAIATVLSVVEPWFSHVLGGGTWALYYDAENGEVTSLDGVGPTGKLATRADYAARSGTPGMHQANVPGAWDGWMIWLDRYGRLDLGEVMAPAIRIATGGYPVSAEMADFLGRSNVLGRPPVAAIYAPEGRVLGRGETVYQHNMAGTFEELVAAYEAALPEGRTAAVQAARDYYYRGPIAEAIVAYSNQLGGYLTLDDFAGFEAQIVEPLALRYNNDVTVYQSPPNSQGITMLMALNILRHYDIASLEPNSIDAWHIPIEAMKLAFADRYYHVGDPDRVHVPVNSLLSPQHADRQRGRINMNSAMHWPIPDVLEPLDDDLGHTTTFHVVDRWGNGAAVTTSLGAQFFVVGETGIHINNRMRFLSVEQGNANQVAAGFKVRHTSNPYMAFRNGEPFILGGNTGADIQAQAQVQQFLNIVEWGMTAQQAVSRPRWVSLAFPATNQPWGTANILRVEHSASNDIVEGLRARGHHAEAWWGDVGNAGAIVIRDPNNLEVGAEPRISTASGVIVPVED